MNSFKTPKGTTLPLKDLKGKDYLEVAYRVLWMREEHPEWGIETEYLQLGDNLAVAKATIRNELGRILAQGTKTETPKGFADYTEKAETGAIGRALALCGYGTQFAHELEEGERIVDSPQPKPVLSPANPTRIDDLPPFSSPHQKPTIAHPGASYVIPIGKYKGMDISRVSPDDLRGYAVYLRKNATKDFTGPMLELLQRIDAL